MGNIMNGKISFLRGCHIIHHPVIDTKMSLLRSRDTGTKEFRELINEISTLVCYEALRKDETEETDCMTPMGLYDGRVLYNKYVIVPIYRAGLGMVHGVQTILPTAKVGHIGMYRDPETHEPHQYYCKLPPVENDSTIGLLLDPMLATGGTALAAIKILKEAGIDKIKLLSIVTATQGVQRIQKEYPDVEIITAAHDWDELDDHAYIIPGLGDAGDRIFGTK